MQSLTGLTPDQANNVLNYYYPAEGYPGGSFTVGLLELIERADMMNRSRLSEGFPAIVNAVEVMNRPGGVDLIRARAAEVAR